MSRIYCQTFYGSEFPCIAKGERYQEGVALVVLADFVQVTYRVTREMDGFADIFSSEDALEGVRQNAARAMDCTDRYEVDELLRSILRTATNILAVWRVRHIWR